MWHPENELLLVKREQKLGIHERFSWQNPLASCFECVITQYTSHTHNLSRRGGTMKLERRVEVTPHKREILGYSTCLNDFDFGEGREGE